MSKDKSSSTEISRREFIGKAAASAVVAGGFYCVGLKAAVAEVRAQGAAPARAGVALNLATLNSTLQNRGLVGQLGANPKQFLTQHFSLTPIQQKQVDGLSADEIAVIQKAVTTSQRENLNIKADCGKKGHASNVELVAQSARLSAVKTAPANAGGTLNVSLTGFAQ